MDSFVNEQDFALLSRDHYTFAVLTRILKEACELIRSNHEDLLLCHSESHYPVWIWTPDNAADEVKETAWELACGLRPLGSGYRYNHESHDSIGEYLWQSVNRSNIKH